MYNTIYPGYIKPYQGVNNRIVKRKEDEDQSQSSKNSEQLQETQKQQPQSSQQFPIAQFPTGQQVSIDYSQPSVNIAQILTDFKNTTVAIGAPDDIKSEVMSYLNLIETQSNKETPNKQVIKSNLKNASQILDGYITETLQKPSKVVENWIDALFLQQVDYKSDPEIINPEFQVQIEEKKQTEEEVPLTAENSQVFEEEPTVKTSDVYIPQDKQLKRMFVQAKKFSAIDEDEKALNAFKQTLDYAKSIEDTQAQAMVYYEVAQIYDKNNYLPEAVQTYNEAIKNTQDNNIKTRSHIGMAQIYDDVAQFEPAVDHYYAAISFAGEAENLNAQTKALTNLANMHCNRYDKQGTYEYISLATDIAKETNNNKVIGSVYQKSADMSERLDENPKALDFYRESTRYYSKTENLESVVKNYQSAANVMLKLGDKAKARTLLEKAFIKAQNIENPELTAQITTKLKQI